MTRSSLATDAIAAVSTEIRTNGPYGDLVGTLISPPDGVDVVLIIPGSGPTNRDGNNPFGVTAQPYKLLAEGLAREGIASVRIDKRGMFASSRAIVDPNAVTLDDYVQDTLNWVSTIQQQMGSKCIWLIGHSEGGLVALATVRAALDHPLICGLILIAAPGHPLGKILKRQIESNPANAAILTSAIEAINALEASQNIPLEALPPFLQTLFHPKLQGFLISLFAIDPAELIEEIEIPVLIVQGKRDLQVELADAERLKLHRPSANLAVFPDANHLMKQVMAEDRESNIATYSNPDLPLVPHLVDTIAQFISRRNA